MTQIAGKKVLVTGGAMGMGRLFAERCLERGAACVVLWDIDGARLATAAKELGEKGTVHIAVVNVSDPDAIIAAAEDTLRSIGPIQILFNNAGVVVGKSFGEHSHQDIERSVGVNVNGVMHVARAFLPSMFEARDGHIVNMASAAGLTPNPNMSVYAATKWAVLGWSESLRLELEPRGLHVTTVCPSYVDTGMFEGAKAPMLTPILKPDNVVEQVLRGVESDRIILRLPGIVNLLPLLRGILPARLFDWIVGRGFGIYGSMERFHGH